MPRKALSQLFVERIGPPKNGSIEFADVHLKGFRLRVYASGVKSWSVVFRPRGTDKLVRETIGTVAAIPSVAEARRLALVSLEKARSGVNPVEARRAAAERIDAGSFEAVAARFLAEHVERNCRPLTIREWHRMLARDILPHWASRPVREITRGDVNELLDGKAAIFPLQADEVRKHLRTLFAWARDMDLIEIDPTNVRKRAKAGARDRVLSDVELEAFWRGCERLGWPFGPMFKLLLLTAQRRQEVSGAAWPEFDLAAGIWTIPRERAKNDKAHVVHLPSAAVEILAGLPRLGPLVFTANGAAPSGYSKAKARLDGYMAEAAGAPVAPWVLHDLRRSAASGMARLGVGPHIVDKLLNHTAGTIRGVAAIYNRYDLAAERRAALETWGEHVATLIRAEPAP